MNIYAAGLVAVVLVVSARTRLTGSLLGQPLNVPVLWLVAAALVLVIVALILCLVRSIVRDLQPRMVPA